MSTKINERKKGWRDNIGRSSGPIASVYWCRLCKGPHASNFRVVVTNRNGYGTASKAMAQVQAHIKAEHNTRQAITMIEAGEVSCNG